MVTNAKNNTNRSTHLATSCSVFNYTNLHRRHTVNKFQLFKGKKEIGEYTIKEDARGKFWFSIFKDGVRLAQAVPPGYNSHDEALEAIQLIIDIEQVEETS